MQMRCMGRTVAAVVLSCVPFVANADDTGVKGAPFSALVVFSGSLTDTGNAASVSGDFPPPLYKNRTTNGPAAIDILASTFHLSSDPSLYLVGKQAGTNYAVLHANAYGDRPIDLPAQVQAYMDQHSNRADPKALYFIFIGANDIVLAALEQDNAKAKGLLDNGIASVETAFRRLHAAGANLFYAPNNVNLGLAPITKQYGIADRATQFTIAFNRMWEERLRQLEKELHITIFRFDFFRLVEDMVKVSGTIGFTDVTHPCTSTPGCDLERFAFLDPLLPTERVHQFLGNGLAEALVQQLGAIECTVNQRCGRKNTIRAYGAVDLSDDQD
jgi:cholinesterase